MLDYDQKRLPFVLLFLLLALIAGVVIYSAYRTRVAPSSPAGVTVAPQNDAISGSAPSRDGTDAAKRGGTSKSGSAASGNGTDAADAAQDRAAAWKRYKQYDTLAELNSYLQTRIASRADTASFIVDTDDSDMPEIYLHSSFLVSGEDKQVSAFINYLSGQIIYMTPLLFRAEFFTERGDEGRVLCRMELHYRPGVRIADAWERNPDAPENLTDDERAALRRAEAILRSAREEAAGGVALERSLHDRLCDAVTYEHNDGHSRVDTAVGALVDGRANCQGYVDAFYLLGTMAGFTVDMMSARPTNRNYPRPPDSNETHIVNTIELGGKWYIVDATWDDTNDVVTHTYFNAGHYETLGAYNWEHHWEIHPIENNAYAGR